MKRKIIWDDDFDNPQVVDIESEILTSKTETFRGDEVIQTVHRTWTAGVMPGVFRYYLKRFRPFHNAGGAYEQVDGSLWIECIQWKGGVKEDIIYAYSDGYGEGWMLD